MNVNEADSAAAKAKAKAQTVERGFKESAQKAKEAQKARSPSGRPKRRVRRARRPSMRGGYSKRSQRALPRWRKKQPRRKPEQPRAARRPALERPPHRPLAPDANHGPPVARLRSRLLPSRGRSSRRGHRRQSQSSPRPSCSGTSARLTDLWLPKARSDVAESYQVRRRSSYVESTSAAFRHHPVLDQRGRRVPAPGPGATRAGEPVELLAVQDPPLPRRSSSPSTIASAISFFDLRR
jgi:hypothetical protein